MSRPPGLVTPEAVGLDLRPAALGSRLVALGLDLLIEGAALFAVFLAAALVEVGGTGAVIILLLSVFGVLFGYPIAFEVAVGRTPGKMVMGLRVVTEEGLPPRFRHAAVRAALMFIDLYLTSGSVGVLSVLFSKRAQRVGDHAAGTLVVQGLRRRQNPVAHRFAVPPGLEPHVADLDLSRITSDDYATIRRFLLRAGDLPPEPRARVAGQLLRVVAERTRQTIPPGVDGVAYLAAIVARLQARGDR